MKYVVGRSPVTSGICVMCFGDEVVHVHVAAVMKLSGYLATSAGFYDVAEGTVTVREGQVSESLRGMGPAPGDAVLIEYFLFRGLSGLDLANLIAYREIEARKRAEATPERYTEYELWGVGRVDDEAPPEPPRRKR